MSEEDKQTAQSRRRTGTIVAIASVVWWIVSIGGVITTINMQS